MVDSPEDVEAVTGTASPRRQCGEWTPARYRAGRRLQSMMEDSELNFQSFQQRLAITYHSGGNAAVGAARPGYPGANP